MQHDSLLGRRDVIRIGGLTLTTAALVSACGGPGPTDQGTSGARVEADKAVSSDGAFNDAVLLRTATSLHYSAMKAIDSAVKVEGISAKVKDAATAYKGVLSAQAKVLADATSGADGTVDPATKKAAKGVPYEKSNPVFDTTVIKPALDLIGKSKSAGADADRLVQSLLEVAAATHQFYVPLLSQPALRLAAMQIGATHGRAAAVVASLISPDNVVSADAVKVAAPPAPVVTEPAQDIAGKSTTTTAAPAASGTPDVEVYQIPAVFGQTGAVNITLGNVDNTEADKRRVVGIGTLFSNSFIYESMS